MPAFPTLPALRIRLLCHALLPALIALAVLAPALHATIYTPGYPIRPKEFDIIREGATFHIFYIRDRLFVPYDSTTVEFGHATSQDLITWEEQDPVLHVRAGEWDNTHVWAPSIVKQGGLYYLFYAGVTYVPGQYAWTQRIGVATSPDLWHWTRLDHPVWSCEQAPWTYCDPQTALGGEFRDPCVIPDPGHAGEWLMYFAARTARAHDQMAIGVAHSSGDLLTWSDAGTLWSTATNHTGSELVESAELFQHNGLWYAFYTTNSAKTIAFQTAASPLADSSAWSLQVRLADELPEVYTTGWFGVELYSNLGHDYLLAANSLNRSVEIREVVWDDPPHFSVKEPVVGNPSAGVAPGSWGLALDRVAAHAGGVRLRLTLPAAMRADLDVIDVQGRRVRSLLGAALPAGATEIEWDGDTDAGGRSAHGVYFALLRTPAGRRTLLLPLLR
jgi:hypothetical protein